MHYPVATVSRSALLHNFKRVRQSSNAKVVAVIKANAYGHGMLEAAKVLQEADAFAVARLDEALLLREHWPEKRILLLEGVESVAAWQTCARLQLDAVVHHPEQIKQLQSLVDLPKLSLWLKVDTGMHRLGVPPDAAGAALDSLKVLPFVREVLLMTHFACADEPDNPVSDQQLQVFRAIDFHGERSLSNSAAILSRPQAHAQWVRPGIMLYGASPFVQGNAVADGLRAVMRLSTRLIAVQGFAAGSPIGYAGTYRCPERMPVGVAAIGYGDGYPRHAPFGTPVLVDDIRCALIGRVSMDMLTIDLRNHPAARIGSEVELWGPNLAVDEIAACAKTISYALFCGVTARVPRVWGA